MTKKLLTRLWNKQFPVDMLDVARRAGLVVHTAARTNFVAKLNHPDLIVNTSEKRPRKRFAIGHLVGRSVLFDEKDLEVTVADFSLQATDSRIVVANQFALELLMPEPAIRYLIEHKKISSIAELAREADVAELAMAERLKMMGIITKF